jgi:hypothetical protein
LNGSDESGSRQQLYGRRFWDTFWRDAWDWAKEHVAWGIVSFVTPLVLALAVYGLRPDYRIIWSTVAFFFAALIAYCLLQVVRVAAKLDKQRANELAERDERISIANAELARVGTVIANPLLALIHERQRLEQELEPLVRAEEYPIRVIPAIKIGKDEDDYRREKIDRLKRDIAALDKQIEHRDPKPFPTLTTEWKELSDRFGGMSRFIRADWQRGGLGKNGEESIENWQITGEVNARGTAEPICRIAGKLLSRSPAVMVRNSKRKQTEGDDIVRWLNFLKDRGAMTLCDGYGLVQETSEIIMLGSIHDLAQASRLACLDCAAREA